MRPISIKIQLKGFLARIVDEQEIELDVPAGSSVAGLITKLAIQSGTELKKVILDRDGSVYKGIAVSVNQEVIPYQRLAEIQIAEGSTVALIPLAAGG